MADQNKSVPALDRLLGYLSPRWGAERAAYRSLEASYRGGISTRLSTGWNSSTSYQFGTLGDRRNQFSMRDRARKVYKDNAIGRSILDTETDNVVGDGFTLQAQTEDKDFNAEAEDIWNNWLDTADIRGMRSSAQLQRMVWSTTRKDGDGGIVLVDRGGDAKLQYIPGDLISTPDKLQGDRSVIDGVEMDGTSRPRNFYILDTDEFGKREWGAISARNFVYLPHLDDPFDVRGTTCFAQIFQLLEQLDGYVDGVITAARMATIFGLIFKKENPTAATAGLGLLTNSQGDQQKAITLENGMAKYVGLKDEVAQVQATQPMQQTPDFVRIMLRLIGLPFSMPLELVLRDVSQANLSSLRGGRQDFYRACKPKQCWYIDRCWSQIYRWRISIAVKNGEFTSAVPEEFFPHEFLPQGWQFTDPVNETQAAQMEIDAGFNSPQNVTALLGRDYELVQRQNAEARKLREELELPPASKSNMTRDEVDAATNPQAPDPELERLKAEADAYGVGVRAGVISPQTDDEDSFRARMKLPPMSKDVAAAWKEDKGVRRPITLTQPGTTTVAPPPGAAGAMENAALTGMLAKFAEQKPPVVNVNIPKQEPAQVNFTAPAQAAPVVNVNMPDQKPRTKTIDRSDPKKWTVTET